MKSIYYQNLNFSDSSIRQFIEQALTSLYDEIQIHLNSSRRRYETYHIVEYGEMTMVNFLINGLIRSEGNKAYTILNEMWIDKANIENSGRADIIIEDIQTDEIFYVEAKIHASKSDAPSSVDWTSGGLIEEGYESILKQARKYVNADWKNYLRPDLKEYGGYNRNTFYAVAIVFDSVVFERSINPLWYNYIPQLGNEFYTFKTFPHINESIAGLACYGKIEKINPTEF